MHRLRGKDRYRHLLRPGLLDLFSKNFLKFKTFQKPCIFSLTTNLKIYKISVGIICLLFFKPQLSLYGLDFYFFPENLAGSATQNLRTLFTVGTGFIKKGFNLRTESCELGRDLSDFYFEHFAGNF